MDRVAGKIDCTDERCVDVTAAKRSRCNPQGVEAAVFLTAHGKARPGHVVLTIQPVGDQVRHRAEHHPQQ